MRNSGSFFRIAMMATGVFFLLTTAVAVNLLVSSGRQIDDAYALDRAVLEVSALAEGLKSSNGDLSLAIELLELKHFDLDDEKLTIYYDEDMALSKKKHSAYHAVIKTKNHDLHSVYHIKIFKNNDNGQQKPLYALQFKYIRGGGDDVEQ